LRLVDRLLPGDQLRPGRLRDLAAIDVGGAGRATLVPGGDERAARGVVEVEILFVGREAVAVPEGNLLEHNDIVGMIAILLSFLSLIPAPGRASGTPCDDVTV